MGLRERVSSWFLLDWDQRAEAWRAATTGARAVSPQGVVVLQDMLEKQLDRVSSAASAVDTKAALIIPGVGVIVGALAGHVSDATRSSGLLLVVLGLMLAVATVAVLLSLLCLAPTWRRANGPEPLDAVLASGESELRVRLSYLNQLGLAVETTGLVLNAKVRLLNWAIRMGGAGTLLLLLDASLGGLK